MDQERYCFIIIIVSIDCDYIIIYYQKQEREEAKEDLLQKEVELHKALMDFLNKVNYIIYWISN